MMPTRFLDKLEMTALVRFYKTKFTKKQTFIKNYKAYTLSRQTRNDSAS